MATLSSRPRQPTKPTDVQRLARRRVVEREISTLLGRLREEIARRKFSQEALARSLGWSPSTLSELLSQKRTVELYRVLLICRVVGVPLKDLLYPNDETATEQLQLLLETRPKPGEFLVKRGGPFDAAELASATRELLA
jgi:transcriptional regulator with XRE-family HTH domain